MGLWGCVDRTWAMTTNQRRWILVGIAGLLTWVALRVVEGDGFAPPLSGRTDLGVSFDERAGSDRLQGASGAARAAANTDLGPVVEERSDPVMVERESQQTGHELESAVGKVVDRHGEPVAGAAIWVRTRIKGSALPWPWAITEELAGFSDGAGQFAVTAGPQMDLEARKSGFSPSRLHRLGTKLEACVLSLRGPAARLVVSAESAGKPVPGARLDVRRSRSLVSSGIYASRQLVLGSGGRLELDDLAPGMVTLIISGDGFAPTIQTVELRANETIDALLELDVGASLTGKVVGALGQSLAGIELSLPAREPPVRSITGEDGVFQWNALSPGPARLLARGVGFLPYEQELLVSPGKNGDLRVVLEALSSLTGQVLDTDGEILAGATVIAATLERKKAQTQTDMEGCFEIHLPAGYEYALSVRARGQAFAVERPDQWTFRAPAKDLLLHLSTADEASAWVEGCALAGMVPLAGARIELSDGKQFGRIPGQAAGSLFLDDEGRFRIGPLPAREFTLFVYPAEPKYPNFSSRAFVTSPGQVLDLGDLQAPPHATMRVSARFEDGTAPVDALLEMVEAGGAVVVQSLDAEGAITVGLVAGSYRCSIYGAEVLTEQREFTLEAGQESSLNVTLKRAYRRPIDFSLPAGEVAGTVRIANAQGQIEAEIELDAADSMSGVLWPALTGGRYRAQLSCGDRRYVAGFDFIVPAATEAALKLNWVPADH